MSKIKFFSVLDVDAMYFHSAVNNLSIAIDNKKIADAKNAELESIPWLNDYEAWDLGDEIDISFSNEESDYVEGLKAEAKAASGLFLQTAAATHIFCVAALEAHINKTAKKYIKAKKFEHFEKLSIEGKWLFLPQLLGKNDFDPGNQPFQGFSKLIQIRNKLVHHKGNKVTYSLTRGPIGLYESLGLSVEEASKSVESTKKMIENISELLGHEKPTWTKSTSYEYLRLEVEHN